MRQGRTFKRCTRCGKRVPDRRCPGCGAENAFTWTYAVDVAPLGAPRAQQMKGGFKTKAEALAAMAKLQTSKADGTFVQPSKVIVNAYLEAWLAGVRGQVRASTYGTYQLKPLIGNASLQALTRNQVKAAYQALAEDGRVRGGALSAKTVHNVHLALRRALGDAVNDRFILHNPAEAAHKLPTDRPEMVTWTAEELRVFLASIEDHPLFALYRLAASTGMRRGEVMGLRWQDLQLNDSRLSVRQQLARQGEKVAFGQPKTKAGRRSIALDSVTVAALQARRKAQAADRLLFGPGYQDHDLVFARADGSPYDPDVVSQTFERLIKEAQKQGRESRTLQPRMIRFHDLRHTHATLALQAGVSVKVVAERLGHTKASVAQDIYQHVIPGMQEDAATRIARVVDGATELRPEW